MNIEQARGLGVKSVSLSEEKAIPDAGVDIRLAFFEAMAAEAARRANALRIVPVRDRILRYAVSHKDGVPLRTLQRHVRPRMTADMVRAVCMELQSEDRGRIEVVQPSIGRPKEVFIVHT